MCNLCISTILHLINEISLQLMIQVIFLKKSLYFLMDNSDCEKLMGGIKVVFPKYRSIFQKSHELL
jgi:hypothetical protein